MLYFVFLLIEDPVNILIRRRTRSEQPQEQPVDDVKILKEKKEPLSTLQIAKVALLFSLIYLSSNYATNFAFGTTSVGSASILAATCGFFTLIIGWALNVEIMNFTKILAVLVSVGGVLLLGWHEFRAMDNRFLGNALALLGAVLYGVYSVYLKKVSEDESRISMPLLFAFGGLYTLLLSWPIVIVLHLTAIETLAMPPSWEIVGLIIANVFLGGFLPNYLWNVAFVCTNPLLVAIGLSFNIPITLIAEHFADGTELFNYKLGSGLVIVLGFLILNYGTFYPSLDAAIERKLGASS